MQAAGAQVTDDPNQQVAHLEALIAGYPEGQRPNQQSVYQFVALLGEAVRAVYGGQWVRADVGAGEEIGVVTEGPHGPIFWNLTGKLRRRLQGSAEQDSLIFYWQTIGEQLAK